MDEAIPFDHPRRYLSKSLFSELRREIGRLSLMIFDSLNEAGTIPLCNDRLRKRAIGDRNLVSKYTDYSDT